jgi:hypothetical protein
MYWNDGIIWVSSLESMRLIQIKIVKLNLKVYWLEELYREHQKYNKIIKKNN